MSLRWVTSKRHKAKTMLIFSNPPKFLLLIVLILSVVIASVPASSGKCGVGSRETCSEPDDCPPNSHFGEVVKEKWDSEQSDWTLVTEMGCSCDEGFAESYDHESCLEKREYGESCEGDDLKRDHRVMCGSGSGCLNGTCQCYPPMGLCWNKYGEMCDYVVTDKGENCICRDEMGEIFDIILEKCVTLIGGACDELSTCAPGGVCNPDTRTCECHAGLHESENKARCFKKLTFGDVCIIGDPNEPDECDPAKGLMCDRRDGRGVRLGSCICGGRDPSYSYDDDEEHGGCLAPIGKPCGNFKLRASCLPAAGGKMPACEYFVVGCAPGAQCMDMVYGAREGVQGVCRAASP